MVIYKILHIPTEMFITMCTVIKIKIKIMCTVIKFWERERKIQY